MQRNLHMKRDARRKWLSAALFGAAGISTEVLFTALMDYRKNRDGRLPGQSYAWMFPVYASVPLFLGRLYPKMRRRSVATRLGIYVPLLMGVEYATGFALRRLTGECPWERNYRGSRWNVHGLVRIDYAPAWAVACYGFERLYRELTALSAQAEGKKAGPVNTGTGLPAFESVARSELLITQRSERSDARSAS